MTKDEALKLALEFIENSECGTADLEARIKKALAQPEQEPFAYVNVEKRRLEFAHDYVKWDTPTTIKLDKIPLYTAPPQRTWQGLTADEIETIWRKVEAGDFHDCVLPFAEKLEARLKEKNSA